VRLVDRGERARARLGEYLRARGLEDRDALSAHIGEIVRAIAPLDLDEEAFAAVAVDEAEWRIERWLRDDVRVDRADPRALRRVLERSPAVFLSAEPTACDLARRRLLAAEAPRHEMPPQSIRPITLARWLVLFVPIAIATAAASYASDVLFRDSVELVEIAVSGFVWILFALGALGATLAAVGYARPRRVRTCAPVEGVRTAILMPIYNEDPTRVFAHIEAIRSSLGPTVDFEIWVLSDTRDPALLADEEQLWRRIAGAPRVAPVFYRRREDNRHQKAGNIADFCERWSHRYRYMVVLDADSLVSGSALREMVARMERSPPMAILQAPVALVGGETLCARVQSFAHSLYGPLFFRGLAAWSGRESIYFGHNAIVRMSAFVQCCGLPVLEGRPPFGGPILSHDFVEAALLVRAGWEVRLAPDLEETYEAPPPTLREFLARDRRWCQGNLQNLRVALAQGLKTMSRTQLVLGALAYAAAPLWLAFLLTTAFAVDSARVALDLSVLLTGAFALLAFPKLLGAANALRHDRARSFGGPWRLALGSLVETAVTSALAPILMWKHTRFVLEVIAGRAIGWSSQRRRADPSRFRTHLAEQLDSTLAGVLTAAISLAVDPIAALWLAPVYVPLAASSALSFVTASPRTGRAFARVLAVPCERKPPPIVAAAESLATWTVLDDAGRFRDLVLDPVLNRTWIEGRSPDRDRALVDRLVAAALAGGPAALSREERARLVLDPEGMTTLHREAWKHWPVERWKVGTDLPREPRDESRPPSAPERPAESPRSWRRTTRR
jgi:membrane glycosyltransferase